MILILEDNTAKLQSIILDYPTECIYIQRTVYGAMTLVRQLMGNEFDLVLDNELAPGCGTGLEFLEKIIAVEDYRCRVKTVRCISFSKDVCKEMFRLCIKEGIKWKGHV